MKVYANITVELEVDHLGMIDDATDYAYQLQSLLRWNHPTPMAGVTVEDVHRPIIEWEDE